MCAISQFPAARTRAIARTTMAPAAAAGKEHAVLAYLITEPELSIAGPLDHTLDVAPDDERLLAALAYEAAPGVERCWLPARRRPIAAAGLPIA